MKITKEKLIELYIEKNLSQREIGEMYGCDRKNIFYYIKKFDIIKPKEKTIERFKTKIDKQILFKMISEGMTCIEISKKINVGRTTVKKRADEYGFGEMIYNNQQKRQSEMMKHKNPVPKGSKRPEISKLMKELKMKNRNEKMDYLMTNTFDVCKTFKEYAKIARQIAYAERKMSGIKDNLVIDHIFSIKDGFDNKVPLPIISHKNNIRFVSVNENSVKGAASLISLEKLYEITK
ncbi:MAG: hypothetical protein ACRCX2_15960 [Paraclostridium sp.]